MSPTRGSADIAPRPEPGSFRDRNGRVLHHDGRIYRALSAEALANWRAVSRAPFFLRAAAAGSVVATHEVAPGDAGRPEPDGDWAGMLEHERVPFVSYPYEWPFAMLREAALLQLRLLEEALGDGFSLKDATPYNVQWRGSRPVFIDIPSFVPYVAGQPWLGYRQFCELFLYPLLLRAYRGIPFQPLLRGRLEGITPATCRAMLRARDLLRPGVFADVVLHARASRTWADTETAELVSLAGMSKAMVLRNVRRVRGVVEGLRPPKIDSAWVDYRESNCYVDEDREAKRRFVDHFAAGRRPELSWDLGANTGEYAHLAARHSGYVVAMDADVASVGRFFAELHAQRHGSILPLLVDLADPPPAIGWRCRERHSLWARGAPDLLLALALVHHVVITANVVLDDLVDWLAALGGDLLIEFVAKTDPMAQRLLRNKADQYRDLEQGHFESCLERHYRVEERLALASGQRVLYACRRLSGQA